jgi:hypothetical protein
MTRAGKKSSTWRKPAKRRSRPPAAAELESEAGQEVARLMESFDPERLAVSSVRIEPRRADTVVQPLALAWVACPPPRVRRRNPRRFVLRTTPVID